MMLLFLKDEVSSLNIFHLNYQLTDLGLDEGGEVGASDQEFPALVDLPGCDEIVKLLK